MSPCTDRSFSTSTFDVKETGHGRIEIVHAKIAQRENHIVMYKRGIIGSVEANSPTKKPTKARPTDSGCFPVQLDISALAE